MRRYAAVIALSRDLESVLLVRKLRPAWQAGKANVPGGKVEATDFVDVCLREDDSTEHVDAAFVACAARELTEETGLVVAEADLLPLCFLRYPAREGDGAAECRFFCCVADIAAAETKEEELVFRSDAERVCADGVAFYQGYRSSVKDTPIKHSDRFSLETPFLGPEVCVDTMPNLPWLVAMARQRLRSLDVEAFPLRLVEAPRGPHHAHGRGTADAGPDDPDCPCRATPRQAECAAAGCGFCRAAAPKPHESTCPRGRAGGAVAIECKHGFDVCPKCDPCTCGRGGSKS